MGAEGESRDGSAGHSQSSEAEPDLAAGAAVDARTSTEAHADVRSVPSPDAGNVVIADWKTSKPLIRDCNYGGSFCELLAVEAVQEYLNFHGLQETQKSLVKSQCPAMLSKAFSGIRVPEPLVTDKPMHDEAVELEDDEALPCQGPDAETVQAELAVTRALQNFDDGKREPFLQQWKTLVPSSSLTGGSLELRLRVYFGTYKTRKALLANDPDTPLLEPDFSDLKAFLSSRPSAMGADPSSSSLSSLYALPFVPQPHQNSALRFIFEEPWSQQLRSDIQAFMTSYSSTRHAPLLRQLAGCMIMSRCPLATPAPSSWLELLRLAETSISAASYAVAKLQTFGSCPEPQSLEQGSVQNTGLDHERQKEELLNWLGTGGKMLPELQKQVLDLRRRLGAVARHATDEAPSVQETPGSMRPSIQSLVRAQSVDWEPQGVSTPVPLLQDRLWPREALRGSSASSLNASHSNAGAVRRLHSARSIESRARTATALLPVPPALDFGRIAQVLNGEQSGQDPGTPPILSVLRAVLRRVALPDEAIRPRRAFLAAFACFGAVRALATKLPEMLTDQRLLEMSLAVMGVCACEVVGRREIEAAEAQGTGCISTLISIVSTSQRSLQHMHSLAVLQRLSLRGRLQSKMIQLGALDMVLKLLESVRKPEDAQSWCRLGPGEGPETPDFSIEFTSALLMNLTLRSAGRRRCAELGAYGILVGLIEHPNAQVRTHINGTLYTLLGVKAIRSEAQKRGAEVVFRSALERVAPENELLQRQLEFLLHQLSRGDGDSDGEDSEDGEPPTIGSPEEGGAGDGDDGDNFLDEEELAAHFHLASTSAVGPGDGYSQAEIDANSKAAAAEAAAAEEALRYFRATAGPVADSQQRRFHAFVARSCRNLMSPKRRGHSSDRLASPLSPPMLSPSSSPEPSVKPDRVTAGPPVTVTSDSTTLEGQTREAASQRREAPPMDPYREASPPKGSGKGDGGAGKASQAQATPERGPAAKQQARQGSQTGGEKTASNQPQRGSRPESRQLQPKADVSPKEGRGGRSTSLSAAAGKGRGRGTRSGAAPSNGNGHGTGNGAASVTKSASLPPLPENKASSVRNGAQQPAGVPSSRARSEAPKRNQQAVAAVEVATSVGQDRGFRRPRNTSKTSSSERQAKESNAQLPQLPKRR